ncbi:hypothetical protein ACFYYB_37640 [Streptomyces sp. NPDC002886]|uniref:hypothetical protein n=1 Tax=Streptomyces sp. NPDC002886 TaxID=3364667 RepID=UPI00369CB0BA
MGFLATNGGATLFLLLLIARLRHREILEFRFIAGMLLLIPVIPFTMFGTGALLVGMLATQVAFAAWVMPVPGPERPVGRQEHRPGIAVDQETSRTTRGPWRRSVVAGSAEYEYPGAP